MPILGIDEVGRGPWAGPLVVGAAILPERYDEKGNEIEPQSWQDDLTDSKKLTAKKREKLEPIIEENAIAIGLGWVPASELDQLGLAEALKLATRRAVCDLLKIDLEKNEQTLDNLYINNTNQNNSEKSNKKQKQVAEKRLPFDEIIIDGTQNFLKDTSLENLVSVLPKADLKIKEVSAASIIAKVARDNYMKNIAEKYPGFGFENHVGYGTAAHKMALEKLGPCVEHRRSFAPVARLLKSESEISNGLVRGGAERGPHERHKREVGIARRQDPKTLVATEPTRVTGSRAEQIVADCLKSQGHTILARNHKTKFYEIDIVSATKDHIYFTEVKYRKSNSHGTPLEFIDQKKQKQITFAAESFMKYLSKKLNRPVEDLPSPILAAASVEGEDFKLTKWFTLS